MLVTATFVTWQGPVSPMMLLLIIVVLVIIAGSIWADYRWRKWMSDRRHDRE